MDAIKAFLSNILVQYATKIGGTAVATGGYLHDSVWQMVLGITAVLVGIAGHYFQYQEALNTPPPQQ